jgi:hypothetical protein
MMVGLATATMVESTMIMKKPIIIAHSAFQGFPELDGDGGVAVLICPPRFSSRPWRPALCPVDRFTRRLRVVHPHAGECPPLGHYPGRRN